MAWTYSLTSKQERLIKKLSTRQKALVESYEDKVNIIISDPDVGYNLVGDLQGFYCYDWTFRGVAVRLCYKINPEEKHITFVYFGTRENFYEELKRYL